MRIHPPLIMSLLAINLFCCGCRHKDTSTITGTPASVQQDANWKDYSDSILAYRYPPDWENSPIIESKIDRLWGILAPKASPTQFGTSLWGTINITQDLTKAERPTLEQMFSAKKWDSQKPVAPPKKVRLGKGQCLAYKTEGPGSSDCKDKSNPLNKDKWCLEVAVFMECFNEKQEFFRVGSMLGRHWAGEKDPDLEKNSQVVEKILSSLEFK